MSRVVSYSSIGTPSTVTLPVVGLNMPANNLSMVLLPHPEAPTMAQLTPLSSSNVYGPIDCLKFS